ncbi:harpin HrpZ family protein [Pseudomonas sp. SLFW]|uniref:harpin HrpZ family protein n=1 Tax=Pseudomonas sp. SLFW TaxID=2683259 RepID=UPI00211576DE|nr:harpin HrpZ family protein [Pseudomonas sp. SLFW]
MKVVITTNVPNVSISEIAKNESVKGADLRDGMDPKNLAAADIAQSLIKDGHLDQDSPLGQMVGKQMDKKHPFSSMEASVNPGQVKSALDQVIKDKLGNFDIVPVHGKPASEADYQSVMLSGLGKAALDNLLTKQGEGTAFSSKDMPLLSKVATFMDQNPGKFPAPDSGSWKNELKEDNYLDAKETGAFRGAVDMLGSELQNRPVNADAAKAGLQDAVLNIASLVRSTQQPSLSEAAQNVSETVLNAASRKNGTDALHNIVGEINNIAPALAAQLSGQKLANASQNMASLAKAPDGEPTESPLKKLRDILSGALQQGPKSGQAGTSGLAQNAGPSNPPVLQHALNNSLTAAAASIVAALVNGGTGIS